MPWPPATHQDVQDEITRVRGLVGEADQPVIPPAAVFATAAEAVWYAANRANVMRFTLGRATTVDRVRLACGTASGNIEVGIYRVGRTGSATFEMARVATTGVIPCPTPTGSSIEVVFTAAATLPAGQYALYLWVDNVTATFAHSLTNAVQRAGYALSDGGVRAGGMPLSYTATAYGSRGFAATIETAQPTRRAAALLGDSITVAQGWFALGNANVGFPFTTTNYGVAGETAAQIRARTATALTGSPAVLSVLAGTNSIGNSVSADSIIADLTAIYADALAANATVLACTIPPRNADVAQTALSAGQVSALNAVNTWIRGQAAARVKVVDWTVQLSTGDGVTPNLTYFSDHVHPNNAGQVLMAGVLDDVLAVL